jgi:hypothetical protein
MGSQGNLRVRCPSLHPRPNRMFPLYDENPTVRPPFATVVIIILNALMWVFVQGFGQELPLATSLCKLGLIPAELLGSATPGTMIPVSQHLRCVLEESSPVYTPLTSMFLHGGWFHILANMGFLTTRSSPRDGRIPRSGRRRPGSPPTRCLWHLPRRTAAPGRRPSRCVPNRDRPS